MKIRDISQLAGSTLLLLLAHNIQADTRNDYDIDNDGLIEINSLQDLDQIRHEFNPDDAFPTISGATLYGESTGCNELGDGTCHGYELTRDLSFDSNGNGEFDAADSFWNEGKGFAPFGQLSPKFSAEFHGNGFAITHLYMNYPEQRFVGLFSYNEQSYIHDLSLDATVTGGMHSGSLIGHGWQTRIKNIRATTRVSSMDDQIGGLIGILEEGSTVANVSLQTELSSHYRTGGLIGRAAGSHFTEIAVQASFSNPDDSRTKPGWRSMGGLSGWSDDSHYQSIYIDARFDVHANVGGVIGTASDDQLSDVLITGQVIQATSAGGVIGNDYSEGAARNKIHRAINLLHIDENINAGGIVGLASNSQQADISSGYWASDLSNSTHKIASNESYGSAFFLAGDIQCATPDTNCNGLKLTGFNTVQNSAGQPLWHFNSNTEAPHLLIMGQVFSDKNADGNSDHWPLIELPVTEPIPTPDPEPGSGNSGGNSSGGAIFWLLLLSAIGVRRTTTKPDND